MQDIDPDDLKFIESYFEGYSKEEIDTENHTKDICCKIPRNRDKSKTEVITPVLNRQKSSTMEKSLHKDDLYKIMINNVGELGFSDFSKEKRKKDNNRKPNFGFNKQITQKNPEMYTNL